MPVSFSQSFIQALESLANWLQDNDIPYSIIGGVAVSFIVTPRTTQDIDSLVWLDIDDLDQFLASGRNYGFAPRISDAAEFAKRSRVLLLKHEPSSIDIDVSFGATPFEQELIGRTRNTSLGNFSINLPTAEDLIVMKAIAARKIDYDDIRRIIEIHHNLDLNRIRYWVKQFADVLEMPELIDNLERLLVDRKNRSD